MRLADQFPVAARQMNGQEIIYLDSAATTLKPQPVIDAVTEFYTSYTANVHRGLYSLSEEATERCEKSRETIANFINANPDEIIFVKNTTEGLNLVANAFPSQNVLTSLLEHHSNYLPWHHRHVVEMAPLHDDLSIHIDAVQEHLSNTSLLTFSHVSNMSGAVTDVKAIAEMKGKRPLVVDAAQSVPHMPVDVQQLGCDYLVFSGHKLLGPSGTGVVYAREGQLGGQVPFLTGGESVKYVDRTRIEWKDMPWRYEAGTPNIEGVIGLGAAVDYLNTYGMKDIQQHEQQLVRHFQKRLTEYQDTLRMTVYGPAERAGLFSFNLDGIHPHDISTFLDQDNIYIRAGHHCTGPLHASLGIPASVRASFHLYNTKLDIDQLFHSLQKIREVFDQ